MRFLVDAYNLMHALGMAPKSGGLSLERSRVRFVEWLAVELGEQVSNVTLVFDSKRSSSGKQSHRGLELWFSSAQSADDLIEDLIRAERTPSQLTIVSNDNRLQTAAIRRGCPSWQCSEFVDWLQSPPASESSVPLKIDEEKPIAPSQSELEDWLHRFNS